MKEYDELKRIQSTANIISNEIIKLIVDTYKLGVKHGRNVDDEKYQRIMKAGADNGQDKQDN